MLLRSPMRERCLCVVLQTSKGKRGGFLLVKHVEAFAESWYADSSWIMF